MEKPEKLPILWSMDLWKKKKALSTPYKCFFSNRLRSNSSLVLVKWIHLSFQSLLHRKTISKLLEWHNVQLVAANFAVDMWVVQTQDWQTLNIAGLFSSLDLELNFFAKSRHPWGTWMHQWYSNRWYNVSVFKGAGNQNWKPLLHPPVRGRQPNKGMWVLYCTRVTKVLVGNVLYWQR